MGLRRPHAGALSRATNTYRFDLTDDVAVTCPQCHSSFFVARPPLVPEARDLASRVFVYVRRRGGTLPLRHIYRAMSVTRGTLLAALRPLVERGLGAVVPGRPVLFRLSA